MRSFLAFLERYSPCRAGRRALPAVLAAIALGFGPSLAAAQPAFPLHTAGANIVDSNGTIVHLNAVNWYGAESTDFVVAGLQAATLQSIVAQIKSLGFNAVRLPWSNQIYESNPPVGSYALAANPSLEGENALTIFDQVIDALTSAGIMVILDNHNSNAEWCCSTTDGNELWYNSQYPQSNWIADWQGIAQRYQSNPWVIGADLRNEPRGSATWGGSSATNCQAAAELGGNAVLSVNPHLLIFVEGVDYAGDLSGVATLPVQLNVANQLVYEAHDYGYWYSSLTGYSNYVSTITPKWGYLVTGSNPQPFWIGEFGTCDTADTCVDSGNSSDGGYWFNFITSYLEEYGMNWSYWAVNGTESTGSGRTYGAPETYGILNPAWNGSALALLTSRLRGAMAATASPGFTLIPSSGALTVAQGAAVSSTVALVPQNGFTGNVSLTCSVSGGPGDSDLPACSVPASQSLPNAAEVDLTISISTTGSVASNDSGQKSSQVPRRSGAVLLGMALLFVGSFARRRRWLLSVLLVAVVVGTLSGCGGGASGSGSPSSPQTTAGNHTVTVSGTASGQTPVAVEIALTVQ